MKDHDDKGKKKIGLAKNNSNVYVFMLYDFQLCTYRYLETSFPLKKVIIFIFIYEKDSKTYNTWMK